MSVYFSIGKATDIESVLDVVSSDGKTCQLRTKVLDALVQLPAALHSGSPPLSQLVLKGSGALLRRRAPPGRAVREHLPLTAVLTFTRTWFLIL